MSATLIGIAGPAPGSVSPDGRVRWSPSSAPPASGKRLVLALVPSEDEYLASIADADYDAEHARLCGDRERTKLKAYESLALRRALLRARRAGCYSLVGGMAEDP